MGYDAKSTVPIILEVFPICQTPPVQEGMLPLGLRSASNLKGRLLCHEGFSESIHEGRMRVSSVLTQDPGRKLARKTSFIQ